MAARKTKAPKTTSPEARAFVVVLEGIHATNKVFGEGLQLLREQVDRRFDRVDHDIAEIRHDIVDIQHDVGLVKIAVLDHSRELKEIRAGLEKKVDRDEVEAIAERVIARRR